MRLPRIRTTLLRSGAAPVPSISVPPISARGVSDAGRVEGSCPATVAVAARPAMTAAHPARRANPTMGIQFMARSIRDWRQRPIVLNRAAWLEELGLGRAAAECLRVADLLLNGRDHFRQGK